MQMKLCISIIRMGYLRCLDCNEGGAPNLVPRVFIPGKAALKMKIVRGRGFKVKVKEDKCDEKSSLWNSQGIRMTEEKK